MADEPTPEPPAPTAWEFRIEADGYVTRAKQDNESEETR